VARPLRSLRSARSAASRHERRFAIRRPLSRRSATSVVHNCGLFIGPISSLRRSQRGNKCPIRRNAPILSPIGISQPNVSRWRRPARANSVGSYLDRFRLPAEIRESSCVMVDPKSPKSPVFRFVAHAIASSSSPAHFLADRKIGDRAIKDRLVSGACYELNHRSQTSSSVAKCPLS